MSQVRTSRRRRRFGKRALLGAVPFAFVLVSCASSQFQYVSSSQARTAFKLPKTWHVYDKAAFLGLPPGPEANTPDPIEWLVAIDGDPSPSVDHILDASNLDTDYPQGVGVVQTLSPENRDQASFAYLRNFLIPIDQLTQAGSDNVQLLKSDDLLTSGLRGNHLVYQFRMSALGQLSPGVPGQTQGQGTSSLDINWVRVDQVAYLDQSTSKVFVLAVMCSSQCYDRNATAIEATVNSWTVKPT